VQLTPAPVPTPPPPPVITPSPDLVVRQATSILDLKQKIADDLIDRVILVGQQHISPAAALKPDSLWIGLNRGSNGADMTRRTRPIVVDTTQAPLSGGGATGGAWVSFMDGAHLIEWVGLAPTQLGVTVDGVIKFGGDPDYQPAYGIKLGAPRIDATCRGTDPNRDQAIYFAHALGRGPHDIEIDDAVLDLSGGLGAAFQGYHSTNAAPGADHITVRRAKVAGATFVAMVWDPTVHDWSIEASHYGTKKFGLSYWPDLHKSEQATTGTASSMAFRLTNTGGSPPGYVETYFPGSQAGLV
jgi:hypothetical protein